VLIGPAIAARGIGFEVRRRIGIDNRKRPERQLPRPSGFPEMARWRRERTLIFQNGRANKNMLWMVLSTPSRAVSWNALGSLSAGMVPMRSHSLARTRFKPISFNVLL